MDMKRLTRVVAVICALLPATPLHAQVATATILSNVTDSSGGAVPGATVTATNVETQLSRDTITDESGQYALGLLPLGNYRVNVTLTGFKTFTQTGTVLEVGRNARIDAIIEPGNVAESVSVVGDAPLVDTASAIVTLQSGAPLTITAGQDRNFDGNANDRADLIGDPKLDSGRPKEELIEQWFDTTAFALPAVGADGSAPRSVVDGPGIRNVDLGVFRDTRLGGRASLQFRMEATNVFNMVNLGNQGTNLGAPATFAKIRSTRTGFDMRRIQLGTRVSF